jgi:hypothetical protein
LLSIKNSLGFGLLQPEFKQDQPWCFAHFRQAFRLPLLPQDG